MLNGTAAERKTGSAVHIYSSYTVKTGPYPVSTSSDPENDKRNSVYHLNVFFS